MQQRNDIVGRKKKDPVKEGDPQMNSGTDKNDEFLTKYQAPDGISSTQRIDPKCHFGHVLPKKIIKISKKIGAKCRKEKLTFWGEPKTRVCLLETFRQFSMQPFSKVIAFFFAQPSFFGWSICNRVVLFVVRVWYLEGVMDFGGA